MEQLVNFIIRPPRAEYDAEHDLLEKEFMMRGRWYQRKDLEVKNSRGDVLQCSHYMPVERPEGKPLPCVIYCHGNSGCRADGSEAAIVLLPSNITVFTLDFSGSGLSGGEYVTLGWNEFMIRLASEEIMVFDLALRVLFSTDKPNFSSRFSVFYRDAYKSREYNGQTKSSS